MGDAPALLTKKSKNGIFPAPPCKKGVKKRPSPSNVREIGAQHCYSDEI